MNVLELLTQLRQAKIAITLDGEKLKIKAPQGALTAELKQQLQAAKQDIIEFLKESQSGAQSGEGATSSIPVLDRNEPLPLSWTQVALWTMDKLNPGSIAYNLPMAFRFHGGLDVALLEQAITLVIERHEVLRMSVQQNDEGEAVAIIAPPEAYQLPRHRLHIDDPESLEAELRTAVDHYTRQTFDLESGPLYRFDLLDVSGAVASHQVLVICLHHLISDGLSQNLLVREVALGYAALLKGQPAPLPPLPIQYLDFAGWQRAQLTGDKLDQEIAFWKQQLHQVPSLLALPTDRPRPLIQTTRGAKFHFELDTDEAQNIIGFCQSKGVTLFMGLMTALQVVLSRHAQQDDFCLGMPTAGRHQKEVESLIGFFVNGVLVRADVKGNPDWNALLDRVKNRLLDVLAHQQTPAQLIFDHLDVPRNPSYPPMAQVGFHLQNFSGSVQSGEQEQAMLHSFREMTQLTMEPLRLEEADSKFDIILSLTQQDNALSGYAEYNTDLFDESTIERIITHFRRALRAMVMDPQQRIADVVLETPFDLERYLGVEEGERLCRLTSTQLAFVQDLDLRPETRQYAVGFRFKLHQAVDVPLLQAAILHVMNTHASLRARYVRCDLPWCDPAWQIITREISPQIDVINISDQVDPDGLDPDALDPEEWVERHFDQWCYRHHDIFSEPLSRFQILTYDGTSAEQAASWLTLSCHHIVIDGMSGMAMLQKIARCYEALLAGQDLPQYEDGFPDYVARHHQNVDEEDVIRFWETKALSVEPLSYSLPTAWQKSDQYQVLIQPLDDELLDGVKQFCRKHKAHPSLFYRLVAALLIQEYCRPDADFVLWDIQSGRAASEMDEIGVYYQQAPTLIPLSVLKGDCSAKDFFQQQREYRREIRNKEFMSLAQLNRLFPTGALNFQYNYFNFLGDVEMAGSSSLPYTFSSHVDQTVQVFIKDYGQRLDLELWMDGSVFVPQQFLQRMMGVIKQLISQPELIFRHIRFDLAEESALIQQWNETARQDIPFATVIDWFDHQVAASPQRIALICGDQQLTYQQLDALSSQLAHALLLEQGELGELGQGTKAGDRVGICLGRSPWMLISVLATLKAGASYVPIEASYPKARIEYILEDSGASLLITEACLQEQVAAYPGPKLLVDQLDLQPFSSERPESAPAAEQAIYTIYTSGSTGNPKGAEVRHQGEVNLQQWYTREAKFDATSRAIIVSAFGFDLTQKNLFAPLLCGGAVVIPTMEQFDPDQVADTIRQHQVTHLNCAPSVFYSLVEHCDDQRSASLASLLRVYLGGEPIRLSALQAWLQQPATRAVVVNSYGPTECTDVVSWYELHNIASEQTLIPIGKAVDNTQLHILNDALKPSPLGIAGEICIAGAGVGNGYLNRDELTQTVFVDHPLAKTKLYRTGDLGRYLPDGHIEYIGRKDFQVKLRGLRIELGEIENAIKQLPQVRDALVLVDEENLLAYALSDTDQAPQNWSATLRQSLPDYMVPTSLICLTQWPLTPNGKIDRKALPRADSVATRPYVAPRNETEFVLADIWRQVLKVDQIGVEDSFFELGGHSLLATQIVSRVRKQFAIDLPIRDLITHPTVAALAQRVISAQRSSQLQPLERVDRNQRLPLSAAQQRMWLLDQIEPGNAAYHVPSVLKVKGELDQSALQQAFNVLVQRHESLRTGFPTDEQGPFQSIVEHSGEIQWQDASSWSEDDMRKAVAATIMKPFSLNTGPLYRASVFRQSDRETVLLLVLHHAITDGWSNALLIRELAQLYVQARTGQMSNDQLSNGEPSSLSSPAFQYADYAVWQQALLATTLENKLHFWKEALAELPPLELPLDKPRPAVQSFSGASLSLQLSSETSDALNELANRTQSTRFMVLLAAYGALLQRYSGQDTFAIGTPVSGRERPELEDIVGFFVNTLAIPVAPRVTYSFEQFLESVKESVLAAFEHQEVPFEQIVEELNPTRDMSRSPVFQVMLAYQNLPTGDDSGMAQQLGDLEIVPFELNLDTAKFEQTLTLWPTAKGIAGSFTYNTDLFSEDSAQQFVRHFCQLCDAIAQDATQNAARPLYQLDVLSEQERQTQLVHWNQTQREYDTTLRVEGWFRKTAQQVSEKDIAIQCGQAALTYPQLSEAVDQIAWSLREAGVRQGDSVGLILDRQLHLMSAILGVLRAGAVYIPIDAAYPRERIRFICDDSAIRVVVGRQALAANVPEAVTFLDLDALIASGPFESEWAECKLPDFGLEQIPSKDDDLIYVIYTSGSTGTPKATGAYRRSEINLLNWYIRQFGMNTQDKILLLSAIGFDLTQKNLFAPLMAGATLVIPEFQEYDPIKLIELIESEQITWINCAPSALYPLLSEPDDWPRLQSLRYVFLGGEPINLGRVQPWLQQSRCTLVNSYGPTECADIAAWHAVDLSQDSPHSTLPIGKPNDNVHLYVLDEHQQLLPVGSVGELCIGGDGVGPGYLNNPDLTAQQFIGNPYGDGKLYRTGDRVRWRRDGSVVYLGRKDHQIKLRGYRIETGEIQAVINQVEHVKDSHVDVIRNPNGVEQLVAWVIAGDSHSSRSTDGLAQYARSHLPNYMVPDVWLSLDAFPLTPNGKIDRKQLPQPQSGADTVFRVAPRNELEQALASIWQDVLGLDQVGVHDNFFELGGHSLLATQVAARIRTRLKQTVTIRDFMSEPTINALANRLSKQTRQQDELPLLQVDRQQRIELSYAQQRLWLLDRIEPGSVAYNVPALLRIRGPLDVDCLQAALSDVFNRHEGLRTIFAEDEQGPYQRFLSAQNWPLPLDDIAADLRLNQDTDLDSKPAGDSDDAFKSDAEAELKRRVAIELMTPFRLDQGPLFRARLYRVGEQDWLFCVVIHHIVTDGWSMNLLIQDLAQAYVQRSQLGSVLFDPLPIQYADFAHWQRQRLTESKRQDLLSYWKQRLSGAEPLVVPTDFPRPPLQRFNGHTLRFELDSSSVESFRQLTRDQGTSLFTALMSAYAVLLQRYSGQTDFCIGTPVAGREHTELERIVGFFVNTLAVRMQPDIGVSFRQLVDATRQGLLDDFAHQEVPFEQIVETLDPARDMSRSPLFQVMLAYQNLPPEKQQLDAQDLAGELSLSTYDPGVDSAKYDLTLTLWDQPDAGAGESKGLGASLQYNTDLFRQETMQRLVTDFSALFNALSEQPDAPLSQVNFLSPDQRQQQLVEWNQTEQPYPDTITVHDAFRAAAEHHGDRVAVRRGEQALTYTDLERVSNQFAHSLLEQGIQVGDRVAICLDRNLHLMSVILGVLKAGATYVPLDASYPQERIRYILDAADAKTIICQSHLKGNLPSDTRITDLDDLLLSVNRFPVQAPDVVVPVETLLYLIFTSGSTGKPKGTGTHHRAEMNLLHWYQHQFNMTVNDRVLLLSAIGFDLTQKNLFAPLLAGATLVIPGFQEFDTTRINQLIGDAGITWLNCAPSAFYAMQDEAAAWPQLSSLRLLFLGGEAINLSRMESWLRQSRCQLINSYGPTECTDIATWYAVDLERDLKAAALPIGRPSYNVQLYVLGTSLEMLPIGAVGELCIGGAGVGPGYINNPEQTQASFVANPYCSGETLYRTGDRVRYREDGVIEYLGRMDHQIKLRGYRIEAGEIQSVINQAPGVKESLVSLMQDDLGVTRLVAWVAVQQDSDIPPSQQVDTVSNPIASQISNHCAAYLPAFMVPEQWVVLDAFPLTPNGKVDRKALPQPAFVDSREYVAPETELEQQLCAAWASVLGLERVGTTDNFFQMGGQSLLATRLMSQVSRIMNRAVGVRTLFENPTVRSFVHALSQETALQRPPIKPRAQRDRAPLSFGQQRLWFFEQMNPGTRANSMPVVIRIQGDLQYDPLNRAFRELIRRHESLRTCFSADEQGEPQQWIQSTVDFSLGLLDLSDRSAHEAEAQLQAAIEDLNNRPLPLDRAPLLSASLIQNSNGTNHGTVAESHLLLNMHHIISDGASQVILFREMMTLYLAFLHQQPSPLPELSIHYGDFAQWQRDWLTSDVLSEQLGYWQNKLARAPVLLELPLDFPRPAVQSTEGDTVNVRFDSAFTEAMQQCCQQQGVTPFMFMLLGWKLLLSRYSGQQDIVVGVPTLGRHSSELDSVIGFFIQSLVLRSDVSGNPVTRDALAALKTTVLEAFAHGDIPVDLIIERLGVARNPSYSPLVQVAFQLLDDAGMNTGNLLEQAKVGDMQVEVLGSQTRSAKFDLTMNLLLNDNDLSASLEYSTALFKRSTVEALCEHYKVLCQAMLDGLDQSVNALPLLPQNQLPHALSLDVDRFERVIPLSAMQYDMFMDNLVHPATLQSSHGWHICINRELDVELWQQAIQSVTDQQPLLRCRFVASDKPWLDMGYLAVRKQETVELEVIDLESRGFAANTDSTIETLVRERIYRPYNLQTDKLITHHVIRERNDRFWVVTAVHHAVLDGAALNVYWQQLTDTYNALQRGQSHSIESVDFESFVQQDRSTMDTAAVLAFWRDQLSQVDALDFTLPSPAPTPAHFITRERWLDDDHWQQVKAFSRSHRITPSHYFKCLFGLLIKVYCRADSDFTIQETMGGRIKGHTDALGCYIQEIPFVFPLRELSANSTFADLLGYARDYQKSIRNQRLISIGKQLELSPKGRIGFMFNFYQFLATTEFLGETLSPEGTPSDPANNVQFVVTEVAGRLKMNLFYHGHLFADFGFLQRVEALSRQILAQPQQPFASLEFVSDAAERIKLLETWNRTDEAFDLSLCVHQKFEQQVLLTPDAIAIVDDAVQYSYTELNHRANQLAHRLIQEGIQENDLVGLCAERSCDFLVGILGIMKAGGAYVPMDPKYPQERIAYMLENSAVKVLLTQQQLLDKSADHAGQFTRICLDSDWSSIATQSTANPNRALSPRNRAYMIYTSGSTGMPKGAIVRHDGAMNHIEAERKVLSFPNAFSFIQSAPASSDISVWQFLGPVTCGGTVVVLDDVTHAAKLFEQIKRHHINVVELVPVALQLLMEYVRTLPESERALPQLNWMMATGEAVSVDLVNEWLALYPQIPVVNAYGPTEAADDVIQCAIHQPLISGEKTVPIGKPLANLSVYIVDEEMRLVPSGIAGEVCIGGIGVGEGYWQNPEKTRQAFVPDPFQKDNKHPVMYRTGDLGRWLADGSIEYLDRIDNQVKIRGFRIELGEVEAALSALPGVRENVVVVRDDLPGGKALAAYVVATRQAGQLDAVQLRGQLRERLPDFMVPAALMVMDKLPLTPAGKVDRKALPRPEAIQLGGTEYIAPRSDTEHTLVEIWQSFMPLDRISVRDNFFELGGHSLIGVRIMARVNKVFGTDLQVATLLSTQTIETLAKVVEGEISGLSTAGQGGPLVALAGTPESVRESDRESAQSQSALNEKPALFLIHPVGGDVLCYVDLANALAAHYQVYGLRARGLDGRQAPYSDLNELVQEYCDAIAEIVAANPLAQPVNLIGQSLGGILSVAVASELEKRGAAVNTVFMLDTFSPVWLSRDGQEQQVVSSALGFSLPKNGSKTAEKSDSYIQGLYRQAQQGGQLSDEISLEQFSGLVRVALQNHTLASQYQVEKIEACVHHFTATDNITSEHSGNSWRSQKAFSLTFHETAGGHESMMQGANAAPLANRITGILNSHNNNNE